MMDLADASVEDMKVNQLLETMFEQAGIKGKENMTFEDFKKIFASEEHGEILKKATLGLDGNSCFRVLKEINADSFNNEL